LRRAPGVRRSCFDEASAFAITANGAWNGSTALLIFQRLEVPLAVRANGHFVQLAAEKKAMSRRFFHAPDSREPPNIRSGRIKISDSPPKQIASIVLHSFLNIKFSIRESKQ
jgi:hypothetical protein